MGRVLEALQRQQDNQDLEKDPLAEAIGNQSAQNEELPEYKLPDRIGSPSTPRSLAGAAFGLSAGETAETQTPLTNGLIDPVINGNGAKPQNGSATPAAKPGPITQNGRLAPVTQEPTISSTVDLDPNRLHARLVLFTDPQAVGCEQYRTLRTQIFHAAEKQLTQVILVASAVAGEGKTSTLLNLAWAIAQSREKRVLVIDSDLRRPSVSSYLGLGANSQGFGEVLNDSVEPLKAIRRVADSSLYLLASTRDEQNSTELLSKARLSETFAELRRYFDFILVDAPPVVAFADTRLLANHADAIMMVVRSGLAGHSTIERAIDALPANRILGVVLNGADQAAEVGYYGYYGYGYGYNYNKKKLPLSERLGLKPLMERLSPKAGKSKDAGQDR